MAKRKDFVEEAMVVPDTSPDRHGHPHFPDSAALAAGPTVLDKLRELDAAASPGPWRMDWGTRDELPGILSIHLLEVDTSNLSTNFANAQLAALSHLILPLAEALEGLDSCAKWDGGDTPVAVELNYTEFAAALAVSRTVLAKLEKALGS